jgi:hypothetical protein
MPTNCCSKAYLHYTNQTLLWNLINQINLQDILGEQPEEWFQNIIGSFWRENNETQPAIQTETLYEQLKSLNEKTLKFMVEDLKERKKHWSKTKPIESFNREIPIQTLVEKENKIKFDVDKDEPIRNMDELIKIQQQLREDENDEIQKQRVWIESQSEAN